MLPPRTSPLRSDKTVYADSIISLSEPLSSTSSIFSLAALLTLAYQVRDPIQSAQGRLLTLMYTMSPASRLARHHIALDSAMGYSRGEVLNSFIHFLSPVLNGMAGMLELLTAVDAFSKPEDFRDFWTLEQCNLIREFIEGGGPRRRMEGYEVPFLETFVQDPSCRIALGKNKGILLLVPGDAQPGDHVWWDDEEQRLVVTRGGDDELAHAAEGPLDESAIMAVPEIRSAN